MKTSGIWSAFTFSVFLHVLIVTAAFVIARHSSSYKIPSAYVVTIVDNTTVNSQPPEAEVMDSKPQDVKPKTQGMDASPKLKNISKKDEITVKERIEALQAKKRIEKIAALRKVVDIKSQEPGIQNSKSKTQSPSSGDYYSMVMNKIGQQWIFPESIDKDLLTIITIKIAKDGSVTIDRIEQSSGNALFDRSALRAINKASPLPPPPQEMEIGVRFRP